MLRILTLANLALLVVFPLSWFAPLMRAGLLPLFGLSEVSVMSGIGALWEEEKALAALLVLLALIAPIVKTGALAALHLRQIGPRALPLIGILGKLAMADVFLIAVYVAIAKGLVIGRLETAWGLWLFTAAVLASLAITILTPKAMAAAGSEPEHRP